jgi:hypothetical protein
LYQGLEDVAGISTIAIVDIREGVNGLAILIDDVDSMSSGFSGLIATSDAPAAAVSDRTLSVRGCSRGHGRR